MTTAEPSINDLNPMLPKGTKSEPVLLLDTSGSMTWPVAEGSNTSRHSVVGEAMGIIVRALEDSDSEAATEQASGSDDKGGLLTFGFADGPTEYGDLNSSNWRARWEKIKWGGTTNIMGAWQLAQEDYLEEFGERDVLDRPVLMVMVITDGEANDAAAFGKVLEGAKAGRCFCIAIVGFGDDHDKTLRSYQAIETANPKRVRVLTFGSETDPQAIADGMLSVTGDG